MVEQFIQMIVIIVIVGALCLFVAPLFRHPLKTTDQGDIIGGLRWKTAACTGFRLCIHGGAGVINKSIDAYPYYKSLEQVLRRTYAFAKETKNEITAVDLAEFAVKLLEDDPLFNAGKGSVYTANGKHEMEASIMDGSNLKVRVCVRQTSQYPTYSAPL